MAYRSVVRTLEKEAASWGQRSYLEGVLRVNSPTVARAYVLAGAVLWSTGGVFIKEIDAGALSITFFRCLFAALWVAPFLGRRRFPRVLDAAVSIVLFAALLALYVGATKETTAANAIFLQYTAPVYVIMLAPCP